VQLGRPGQGALRIVAGTAGGRRLDVPPGSATRPTSDRVREAIFNALESLGAVDGAKVLDGFAGSGALGIEALSRGAAHTTFTDTTPQATGVVVRGQPARARAARAGHGGHPPGERALVPGPFDLVLLDPPYAYEGWDGLLARHSSPSLSVDAVVVIESDREVDRAPGSALASDPRPTAVRWSSSQPLPEPLVTRVLYPGSFDPIHNGHLELIEVAARLFDSVVVAAIGNPQKTTGLYSLEERRQMIAESVAHLAQRRGSGVFAAWWSTWPGGRGRLHREGPAGRLGLRVRAPAVADEPRHLGVHTVFIPRPPSTRSSRPSGSGRSPASAATSVLDGAGPSVARRLAESFA
jgi:16S rRNA (guanine966-N2)-methyltransferase